MKPTTETVVVKAEFVAGAVDTASLPPPTLVEVAFAGRSNVGKSTLLNALMGRHALARTSGTPGCTRQLNMFEIRCKDGLELRFADLPGYGWAKRSKTERSEWQAMIEGYLKGRAALRAVVVLVDVRRGIEDEERQLIEFLDQPRTVSGRAKVILVATKIDKIVAARRKPALAAVRGPKGSTLMTGFSGVTGEGREELWQRIRDAAL